MPHPVFEVAPDGPSIPFGDELVLVDTVRVIVLSVAVISIVGSLVAAVHAHAPGQRTRLLTNAGLVALVSSIEFEHLGDLANWRLAAVVLVFIANGWGLWAFFRWEKPAPLNGPP
jgi:hypothetical protein